METDKKDEIKELLGNITDFKSDFMSGDEKQENPDGKAVEKYFHIKLKNQLDAKSSYSNIKIKIPEFLEELRSYMSWKVFENDKLDNKVAKTILEQFKKYFKDETEIEIDSLYPGISGEKIQKLFSILNNYSYPKIVEIEPKDKYTVLVESTYCLRKNIIKKSDQLRKYFLFFSILNKFYKKYKEYLEEFYEFFIKSHIFSDKNVKKAHEYQKDKSFDLSQFDNFIILVVSNSELDLFNKASKSINESKSLKKEELEFNIGKCFQFPLITKLKAPINDKKDFSEDSNNINMNLSVSEKDKDKKLKDSYSEFKYLIENINLEKNFKAKSIYLDLYLNLLAPKSEILNKLDDLTKIIINNNTNYNENTKIELSETKNKISLMEKELTDYKNRLALSEMKNARTNSIVKSLVEYIKQKDPNFKMEI